LGSPDQVKITTHHHWILASSLLCFKILQELTHCGMIGRAVDSNELKNELGVAMKDHCTNEELPLVNGAHFKHIFFET
jgi:hypothetical protein